MMAKLLFVSLLIASAGLANGQTVIVNPDGTHSVVHGSVVVHPDGKHSVIHSAGTHSILVGPNGRHSVVVGTDPAGFPKVIVHPDGRHSVMHSAGAHSYIVGPAGAHTVLVNQLSPILVNISTHMQLLPAGLPGQIALVFLLDLLKTHP